jgi:hypothetical protein
MPPPCPVPHDCPDPTHVPATQHPLPEHVEFSQHGWPEFPQDVTVPSRQMLVPEGEPPRATHVPPWQQPPPVHAVDPLQQA